MICLLGQVFFGFFEHGGDLLLHPRYFLMSFVLLEDTILDTRYILITTSLLYVRYFQRELGWEWGTMDHTRDGLYLYQCVTGLGAMEGLLFRHERECRVLNLRNRGLL